MSRMIAGVRTGLIALLVVVGLIAATSTTSVAAAAATITPAAIAADITAAAGRSNGSAFDPTSSLFRFDTGKTRATTLGGLTVWPNVADDVSYAARNISGGTQH